ncbi:hypothetical protein CDAR_242341 [Caerostris darwini]|uniref:Uncharacterized protein n=1 Tax=Caerostris darwini TaxID=1538125 RepID=A0AAV4RPZ5_9ARAC|nr:hypothetical protein CDAR_242341 [Caerostris darwini]
MCTMPNWEGTQTRKLEIPSIVVKPNDTIIKLVQHCETPLEAILATTSVKELPKTNPDPRLGIAPDCSQQMPETRHAPLFRTRGNNRRNGLIYEAQNGIAVSVTFPQGQPIAGEIRAACSE